MTVRFAVFVAVVLIGLLATGFGLAGASFHVYQKPDARDAGPELKVETMRLVRELEFTDLVSKQSIEIDAWGHLIDKGIEAPCFS